jgi:hypothetical protein
MQRIITSFEFDVLVSENNVMGELPWTNSKQDDKVWLASSFRVVLFKTGIEKAGSVNQLGRELGYRSRVHPGWSVRQIMLGKQPFPLDRLKVFAEYLDMPLDEILRHRTMPTAVTLASTKKALIDSGMHYHLP